MHSPDFLFPRFLVFPPANPSTFYPDSLSFSVQKYYFVRSIMSGTSRSSIEVQDEKTGKMRRHAGLIIIMLNYYYIIYMLNS